MKILTLNLGVKVPSNHNSNEKLEDLKALISRTLICIGIRGK